MRTTLDIEDDVLQAAKELAARAGSTAGKILSSLARRGLSGSSGEAEGRSAIRGGIPLLRPRGEVVTLDHVRKLIDQEGV